MTGRRTFQGLTYGVTGGDGAPRDLNPPNQECLKTTRVLLHPAGYFQAKGCKYSKASFSIDLAVECRQKDKPDEVRCIIRGTVACFNTGTEWKLIGTPTQSRKDGGTGKLDDVVIESRINADSKELELVLYSPTIDVIYSAVLDAIKLPGNSAGIYE